MYIYKLHVHCENYKVFFYIKKNFCFKVYVKFPDIKLFCENFKSEEKAKSYLSKAIKTVMVGKFIFRVCFNCDTKNYYPSKTCINCKEIIFPSIWEIDEKENEKKTKHLGFLK